MYVTLSMPRDGTRKLLKLYCTLLQYSWELWHRQGDYPHGAAAFAFAAAAAAAGFRAQRPESSPGGKPGPGGHTTARMRAGIGYSHVEQVRQLLMACHCNVFLCTCMHAWLARSRPVRPYSGERRGDPCPPACGCTALVHGQLCAPAVRFCSWPVRHTALHSSQRHSTCRQSPYSRP